MQQLYLQFRFDVDAVIGLGGLAVAVLLWVLAPCDEGGRMGRLG